MEQFPPNLSCLQNDPPENNVEDLAGTRSTIHYFPADCFGIEREIVFGVTYVLGVQYSCAVASVFLLWRES